MTLQQLEYVVALDIHKNFVLAAESCGVTQPTLSAMLHKLEEELGVIIFERGRRTVTATPIGTKIIRQAREAVREAHKIKEIVSDEIGSLKGLLRIGIVPTVAPYIVPEFIMHFTNLYPEVELQIQEMKSTALYEELLKGKIDMAIASAPEAMDDILEIPLYKERFYAYFSEKCMAQCPSAPSMMINGMFSLEMMDRNYMWILQEGHCMSTGDLSFCMDNSAENSMYKAGSITTLVRIVDQNGGFTIIPQMHVNLLSEQQKQNVHPLAEGNDASREISILLKSDFIRERLVNAVVDVIKKIIPSPMMAPGLSKGAIRLL